MVERLKIYSYGHSGTTYLIQMLPGIVRRAAWASSRAMSGLIDHNCNTRILDEQNPHAPYCYQLEGRLKEVDKAIILYSDPRNALISLFSKPSSRTRKHLAHMYYKGPPLTWNTVKKTMLGRPGDSTNFREYKDFKAFDIFFNSWLTADTIFDIAFVKYEWLPRIADDLAAFINLPLEYRKPWCEHIKATFTLRSSDWTELDEANQQVLSTMFASLLETQQSLPPFWIKKGALK